MAASLTQACVNAVLRSKRLCLLSGNPERHGFQIGLKLLKPRSPASCSVYFRRPIAFANQSDCASDRVRVRRRGISSPNDFELLRAKTIVTQQCVGVIDLVLPEEFKRRSQVLPQQIDLG